jgi:hypothetical protein
MQKLRGVNGLVNVSMLALSLGIILQTQWLLKDPRGSRDREEEEIRLVFNAVLTVGVLWWPIVWDATIGLHRLIEEPRLLLGFIWVPVLTMLELQYVSQFSAATGKAGRASALFQHSDLNSDTSAIISAAFAMGSLLYSSSKNYTATHIIMYALVFCLAFVVPTLQVPPETKAAVMWRSVQKLILNYAIGFIISGICTDLLKGLFSHDDATAGENVQCSATHGGALQNPDHPSPSAVVLSGGCGGGSTKASLVFTDLPTLGNRINTSSSSAAPTTSKNMWRFGKPPRV